MSTLGYPVVPELDPAAAAAAQPPDLLIVPGGAAGKRLDSRAEAKVLRASSESHDRSVLMAADPYDLPARLAAAAGLPGEPHLADARILVLAESQYQEPELWYPVLQFRAAICHAGWVLASAGIARGRRLTCVPIIRVDLPPGYGARG